MHGSPFYFRLLWALIVLIAVGFFLYQVGERTDVFFMRKTTVDVKRVPESPLEFPSVTICNQNNYRFVFPQADL